MERSSWAGLRLAALVFLSTLSACGAHLPPAPSPSEIPALEARVRVAPTDVEARVRLGVAYRASGRPGEALLALEEAARRDPRDAAATLYLGLTYEESGLEGRARERYAAYLDTHPLSELRDELRRRLLLLEHRALVRAMREAVEREAELAARPPEQGTVAVFPFRVSSSEPELEPLGRALAEMLVTDLSQTERLRVLERIRVQLLLDELKLGLGGLTDPATAIRSGGILGAWTIVQGSVAGGRDAIRLQGALLETTRGPAAPRGIVSVSAAGGLDQLFELEKSLALAIYDGLGVQLTPAERERVNERPTESLQALLAYGIGLQAEDEGRFQEAAAAFERAAELDPSFQVARRRAEDAGERSRAAATSTDQVAVAVEEELSPAEELVPLIPELLTRDPAAELLGTEGLGAAAKAVLELIFRGPGG